MKYGELKTADYKRPKGYKRSKRHREHPSRVPTRLLEDDVEPQEKRARCARRYRNGLQFKPYLRWALSQTKGMTNEERREWLKGQFSYLKAPQREEIQRVLSYGRHFRIPQDPDTRDLPLGRLLRRVVAQPATLARFNEELRRLPHHYAIVGWGWEAERTSVLVNGELETRVQWYAKHLTERLPAEFVLTADNIEQLLDIAMGRANKNFPVAYVRLPTAHEDQPFSEPKKLRTKVRAVRLNPYRNWRIYDLLWVARTALGLLEE